MISAAFRATLLSLAFAGAVLAQPKAGDTPKPGRIEGTVLSTSDSPIARATVRLETGHGGESYSASSTTEADGRFVFENVPPGREYRLGAERPGFLPGYYKATPSVNLTWIPVEAGAEVRGLKITLTAQGVLTGKVLDDRDEPVQFAQVVVEEKQTPPTFGSNFNRNWEATTDDRGQFRIPSLPPGSYLVRAEYPEQQPDSGMAIVPTFYPSSTALDSAAIINMAAGVEAPVTIHLRRERVFAIRGKIVGLPSGQGPMDLQMIVNSSQQGSRRVFFDPRRDGTFVIPRLLPGTYVLRLGSQMMGGPNAGGSARAEVTVSDKDVTGVVMEYRLPPRITGKVVASDGEIAAVLSEQQPKVDAPGNEGTRISIIEFHSDEDPGNDNIYEDVKSGGGFEIRARPGAYTVRLSLVAQTYLRTIQLNGVEVEGVLEIPPKDGTITVTVSRRVSQLSGVVHGRDGKPAVDVGVWLRPKKLDKRIYGEGVAYGLTNLQGRFQIDGLAPGEYHVFVPDPKNKEPREVYWRKLMAPDFVVPSDRKEVRLADDGRVAIELKADIP